MSVSKSSDTTNAAFGDADGRTLYITSTEQHPGERHLYSVPVEGGARTRITRDRKSLNPLWGADAIYEISSEVSSDTVIALGGAEFGTLPRWQPMTIRSGTTLKIGPAHRPMPL